MRLGVALYRVARARRDDVEACRRICTRGWRERNGQIRGWQRVTKRGEEEDERKEVGRDRRPAGQRQTRDGTGRRKESSVVIDAKGVRVAALFFHLRTSEMGVKHCGGSTRDLANASSRSLYNADTYIVCMCVYVSTLSAMRFDEDNEETKIVILLLT